MYCGIANKKKKLMIKDLIEFPFPYKLWFLANFTPCDFINWETAGTVIMIDLLGLQKYLDSPKTIFKIRTLDIFINHLNQFQFEHIVEEKQENEYAISQYKHECFKRDRYDLICNIQRKHIAFSPSVKDIFKSDKEISNDSIVRSDLCFKYFGTLTKAQINRSVFQTTYCFQQTQQFLKNFITSKFETETDLKNNFIKDFPIDMYKDPLHTALNPAIGNLQMPGYYGPYDEDHIWKFFGSFVPNIYTPVNSDENTKSLGEIFVNQQTSQSTDELSVKEDSSTTLTQSVDDLPSSTFFNQEDNSVELANCDMLMDSEESISDEDALIANNASTYVMEAQNSMPQCSEDMMPTFDSPTFESPTFDSPTIENAAPEPHDLVLGNNFSAFFNNYSVNMGILYGDN